ncbi:MAG: glycosyltransferase family 2 protein [Cytophagales bacterium]|nr:glycosyltransferase family 2 protein [Cytophagales bacterium]
MKVTGFTIARNVVKYDYPIVEAITSVLPLCDEFIVAVGNSEDNTLELIKSIPSPKIRVIETIWDDSIRTGGRALALETDKAFSAISPTTNWCFYIQADEVLHEKYYDIVKQAMQQHLNNKKVEGLLFSYKHFYGSYDYYGESWRWYRREIRVVRYSPSVFSYRDAQGFRIKPNRKLNVVLIDAVIYHYGWVKDPQTMQAKRKEWSKYYINDELLTTRFKANEFDYSEVDSLQIFRETHPRVMADRINKKNWKFDHDLSKNKYSFKEKVKRFLSKIIGYRIGEYKNYKLLKL